MKLSKKKLIVITIVLAITLIIINVIIQRNKTITNNTTKDLNISIDSGKSRMWESDKKQKFVYYDNASFSDEFNGLELKINPLFLIYELPEANGSVGAQFYINNKSSNQFEVDTNNIEVVTNDGEIMKPAPGGNSINQIIFNPKDVKKDVIVFFSENPNIEKLDWIKFRFKVINKSNNDIARSYEIKFNITDHPKINSIPKDAQTFTERYQKFAEVNSNLDLLPIQTNNIKVKTSEIDGKPAHVIDLLKSDTANDYSTFSLILSEDKKKINNIFFTGTTKNGLQALLGTAGALGIQGNKDLQTFLTDELVSVINNNQDKYSKTLTIDDYTILITYGKSMGLTFFVNF
ncbi:hypothetical protein M3215_10415 [Bacillus cytotoxicus]|uniref:Uncharacterized protein n=1 Tax=Bacillus cytotoxicus TaxID=580165 RepID=A0ACC6A873_9BACI|nr:hypothetical protein [Bacillus cytotoxicus]